MNAAPCTPLHFAIKYFLGPSSNDNIQLLIKSGACLNSRNFDGKTPEEVALTKNIEIAKFIKWCKTQI